VRHVRGRDHPPLDQRARRSAGEQGRLGAQHDGREVQRQRIDQAASSAERTVAPPPMRTTSRSLPLSDDAASARSRAAATASGRPVVDKRPVEVGEPHRLRRRARHDDERGLADLAGAVADIVVPAVRPVDHVEEPAAEDDGARAGGRLARDLALVGVFGKRPAVQGVAAGAIPLSGPGSGPVTKPSRETEMSAMIRVMPGQTRSAARTHRFPR